MTRPPARTPRDAPPRGEAMAKLRAAARDFAAAWARPRKVERNRDLRVLEAMLTLAFCAGFVAIGAFYDADVTRRAAKFSPGVVAFFQQVTKLGSSGYVFVLTGLATIGGVLARGRGLGRRIDAGLAVLAGRGFFLFALALASGLLSQVIKHLFGRARPRLMDIVGPMHFDAFSITATYASFPSGHTVTAFAMAAGLGYMAPRLRPPLYFVATMVAISRVAIGAHYVSDVLAGAGIGYGCAVLARRAFAARRIVFAPRDGTLRARGRGLAGLVVTRAFGR